MSNLDNDEQAEEILTFENLQTKIEIGGKDPFSIGYRQPIMF